MSSPPIGARNVTDHYNPRPLNFHEEVKKTALAVLENIVPRAAGAAAGALSFTAVSQGQAWLTEECTGWKMLMIWYLFSLIVVASTAKAVSHLAFRADKRD